MRGLRKNKKPLYYANLVSTGTEYLTSEEGYAKTVMVSGEAHLIETGKITRVFGDPSSFIGHITPVGIETYAHGNTSEPTPQGIDVSKYDGFLSLMKDEISADEASVIWENSTPAYRDDGSPDPDSADWIVSRVAKTMNYVVYLLKAVPK